MLHDSNEIVDYKKMVRPKYQIKITIISAQQLKKSTTIGIKKVKDVVDPFIKVYSRGYF